MFGIGELPRTLLRLIRQKKGNVAPTFALTLIPLMTVMGLALDFSRTEGAGNNVQSSLDGAVLAAARALQDDGTDAEIKKIAADFFNASVAANNVTANCDPAVFGVLRTKHSIEGQVNCVQPTTLSGIVGINELEFTRVAKTAYGIGKLDVVFMFDTSGSMGDQNRMKDLQKAGKEAVKIILDSEVEDPEDVRIAISTYASSVNVGADYFKAVTNEEPNKTKCKWGITDRWGRCIYGEEQVTKTCVTGRESTQKYTDAAPGSGAWIKYDTTDCNSATLTPLTNHQGTLISQISTLPTSGGTAGHLGIVWAWYLISPKWSSVWPASSAPRGYDDPDTSKVAILMSDGEFNTDYMSNGDSDAHAKIFCDAMKAEGIKIYSVAFKAPKAGKDILSYCASSTGQFYNATSSDELSAAYEEIATTISDLRIAH